jgi:cell division septation protein DedD
MFSSQRKKRLYVAVGLMCLSMIGLISASGQFMPAERSAPPPDQRAQGVASAVTLQLGMIAQKMALLGPRAAHAAEDGPPTVVRKKLPLPTPAAPPAGEPLPSPTATATGPAASGGEKPKEAAPVEPTLAPAASMPELTPAAPPAAMPAARPELKTTKPKAISAAHTAYPFSILLSSCKERENAVASLSAYRRTGLTPYIVQTDLGGKGLWWRTLLGYYRTLEEASRAKNALKIGDAMVVKTPYANLIGQYESETEAAETVARLDSKAVFAYIVKGPENSFQVMTGAFPSPQAAETQQRELEAQGITTSTVLR